MGTYMYAHKISTDLPQKFLSLIGVTVLIRLHPPFGHFSDFPGILEGVAWESCGDTNIPQC